MSIAQNFPNIKPSLMLSFADTKQLDPRITYTRASTATFYNGITTAMAEQNLVLQSQTFNTTWQTSNSSITANTDTAPDGTLTADTLTATANGGYVFQVNILAAGSYTISCYIKRKTGTGNVRVGYPGSIFSSVLSVTTDWQRFTFTTTLTAATYFPAVELGTSGDEVYIWGAQLEQRSAVTAYTPTTTQAITNYIPALQTAASGVARFDHNPTTDESLGLLIEESRTNLVTYSSQFDNASWTKSQSSITADTIVAPDGTLTGDKLVENTAASAQHYTYQIGKTITATSNTASVYLKAGERTSVYFVIYDGSNLGATFNLTSGTITSTDSGVTSSITSVGNGWYRCIITRTTSASANGGMSILPVVAGSTSYTGDGYSGVFLWGAQLEAGAFATSYIPTVASQVTRAADVATMTGTNFSTWYAAGEWTLYAEIENRNGITSLTNYHAATISDGTNANSQLIRIDGVNNRTASFGSYNGTANQWSFSDAIIAKGSFAKITLGYAFNNVGFASNAGTVLTDSVAQISVQNLLTIGGGPTNAQPTNGCIKKIAYYPMRVTNAQLQALTG